MPRWITISIICLVLSGCSEAVVHVWSSNSEIALLTELYNEIEDDTVLFFHHDPYTDRHVRLQDVQVDVAIGYDLHHEIYKDYLISLERDIERIDYIYPAIDDFFGSWIIPVMFDLPVIVSQSEIDNFGFGIRLDQLSNIVGMTEEERLRYFNPLWQTEFLVFALRVGGVRFFEGESGDIEWNNETLLENIEFLREWNRQIAGLDAQKRFEEQNFTVPLARVAQLDRIDRFWATASTFFSTNQLDRDGLRPRWLQNENGILVYRALSAGIPRASRQKKQAKAFLRWMMNPETQRRYLAAKETLGSRRFGFVGGFSTLYTINEEEIQEEFDSVRMPLATEMFFSLPQVRAWEDYTSQIVEPWIENYINEPESPKTTIELASETQKWIYQNVR